MIIDNIEIDDDTVDRIVAKRLVEVYEDLEKYADDGGMHVFDMDDEKDKQKIAKFMKKVRRVHNWFTVPENHL